MNAETSNPYLLYTVWDPEGNFKGHLLGTTHFVDPEDLTLDQRILQAIQNSQRIFMEIPPNEMQTPDNKRTLGDYIFLDLSRAAPTKVTKSLDKIVNEVFNAPLSQEIKQTIAARGESLKDEGLKLQYYNQIHTNIKNIAKIAFDDYLASKILSLKSPNFKIERLENKPIEENIPALDQNQSEEEPAIKENPPTTYDDSKGVVRGDEKGLIEHYQKEYKPTHIVAWLKERNREIAAKIESTSQQSLFVMGAGHLLDQNTEPIVDSLRKKGWTIRPW